MISHVNCHIVRVHVLGEKRLAEGSPRLPFAKVTRTAEYLNRRVLFASPEYQARRVR